MYGSTPGGISESCLCEQSENVGIGAETRLGLSFPDMLLFHFVIKFN